MGAIDSANLFALDELIIFSFYGRNRARYRRTLDCGANLGLHSIMQSRCGFEVRSFEPDPVHLTQLRANLARNAVTGLDLHPAGLSVADGTVEFVRLLGNTTGSHIAGAKPSPYGEMERISIPVEAAARHFAWADFVKLDIEGHEAEVLTAIPPADFAHLDLMVEIGSAANAEAVYRHFAGGPVNLFAQKCARHKVTGRGDMPTSHRDGSLFISAKPAMPWN